MDAPRLDPHPDDGRRARLERLRARFTAVNLRSRTVRLNRCTRSGAFDLRQLTHHPDTQPAWRALLDMLGRRDEGVVGLVDLKPTDPELARRADDLATLAHHARADWLETGLRDLAVGWPFLEGKAPDGTWLRAPLLLFPVWLEATTEGRLRWQLELRGWPELNGSLDQTLRRLCGAGLTLDAILTHDEDRLLAVDDDTWRALATALRDSGLSLQAPDALPALERFEQRTEAERDAASDGEFGLHHHLILGRMPPSGSAVVGDYDALLAGPVDNQALGRAADLLAVDADAPPAPDLPPAGGPRGATSPTGGAAEQSEAQGAGALASDSSQDAVLAWSDGDRDGLVVQGPPGTGKSQLIANLLTAAIARGQRVLVVCEKRAALDVVAERLGSVGLGEPLAVVHDVSADRNAVCQAIATTLARLESDQATGGSAHVEAAHDAVLERLHSRLALTSQAWQTLCARPHGRPSLAELDERALDDPGHPLPELDDCVDELGEAEAEAALPALEALATECESLAAPHPLAARADWEIFDDAWLELLTGRATAIQHTLDALAELDAGALTAARALELEALWKHAASVLDLFEAPDASDLNRFLLFWVWTDGHAATGEWHQVMQALREAFHRLRPTPFELVLESRDTIEGWIADLDALERLGNHWWRLMLPRYWRIRKLPGEILDRCPSLYEQRAAHGQGRSAPVNVGRLCRQALEWQQLILSLPRDNPFLDFGFQGALAELEDAIDELRVQHDRVLALHKLREQLAGQAEVYGRLPQFELADSALREPFVAAALADRRRAHLAVALREQLAQLRDLLPPGELAFDTTLADPIEAIISDALHGRLDAARKAFSVLLTALEADGARAIHLDRLTAGQPPWIRRFLRLWRRHPELQRGPGLDARTALERAWRRLTLDERSRTALEAPLVDPEMIACLGEDLDEATGYAAARVNARYRERIADWLRDPGQGKPLRLLATQARKRRYRLTLRQLVERFWERGLARVRPVWLCSPDSTASLFPMRSDLFDLVIFDEASQCPVESALPVAVRGRRLLVAGDDQQMPPSHFFQAARGADRDGDDGVVMSSTSLLELARVAWPATTLRWHYRSRHEALITFSNAVYYGGQLITAPRAERPVSPALEGLHFDQVDGLWLDQQNEIEARCVVERVERLLAERTPDGRVPSIGVITFNLRQAELIETLLEARSAEHERLRQLLAADRRRPPIEQLFVRNLENVQGDERDVIVFSLAYGPGEPGGRVHARFGPLGQAGGDKRLNVAITRAKLGLHVISSFAPDELDVSGARHVGPKLFKLWLSYVQAVARGRDDAATDVLERAAELGGTTPVAHASTRRQQRIGQRVLDELAAALVERGLAVRRDFGVGPHRLDLAVGREAGEWRVGVDVASFLSRPDTRARDVYTPRYLAALGWRIVRVTPGAWLEDRNEVIKRVLAVLR